MSRRSSMFRPARAHTRRPIGAPAQMIAAVFCAVLSCLLGIQPAVAEESFSATLTGLAAGTNSPATGSATLLLNDAETAISYTITFSGLTSPENAAHIHNAGGGVVIQLPSGSPKVGVWQFPLPSDVTRLRDGDLYILIHTDNFLMGEIRGDIAPTNVPAEMSTWGKIKALFQR